MQIAGIQPNSFIDYPGKIAYVVFTQGCNFNCAYCHNRRLIGTGDGGVAYHTAYVLEELAARRKFVDGVVITGGEPTLQRDLPQFIAQVRALGLLVKLDTNGTHPRMLKALLPVLDWVAMDIKAPPGRYAGITQTPEDDRVWESVSLLLSHTGEYEFRTTMVPALSADDIEEIARRITGARRYILQQYIPVRDYAPAPRFAHSAETLREAARRAQAFVPDCSVRNLPV